jgi:diaminohydroxyphosphoribosylaminopyrimidine deaminase/5-amino-6-(5-phosphoribosylamino)uracil reductase
MVFKWRLSSKKRYDAGVMSDIHYMRLALRLAQRGYGQTSPNPMVGAVLVNGGKIIGRGWHRRAGLPHAEIEAIRDAQQHGRSPRSATLYVTLEPCCTHGRTPPCTNAVIDAGIKRVVIGTKDPNPKHSGKGFEILKKAGVRVVSLDALTGECARLNESFNHWIMHRTPFVTVKAAMTLDGKIATVSGESKWITGPEARAQGVKLRLGSDAILVGINTILADDPSLTVRDWKKTVPLRRIVLDSMARTPLKAKVVSDEHASLTTIVVCKQAPQKRVAALAKRVNVLIASTARDSSRVPLPWLLKKLGSENVTSLLVEGGGEVNASFLEQELAHRIAFFYAPKIVGGRNAPKAVGGRGIIDLDEAIHLRDVEWKWLGRDLFLSARVARD